MDWGKQREKCLWVPGVIIYKYNTGDLRQGPRDNPRPQSVPWWVARGLRGRQTNRYISHAKRVWI